MQVNEMRMLDGSTQIEVAVKDNSGQTWFSYFPNIESFNVLKEAIA